VELPSLRRHYPDQVLRVLSQPAAVAESTPGNEFSSCYLWKESAKIHTNIFMSFVTLRSAYSSHHKMYNMPRTLFVAIFLLINVLARAQDKVIYDANAEKRSVGSFESIRVGDGIDVYITQGKEDEVAVSAGEVAHRDQIKTVVENGELKISFTPLMGWNWNNRKLRAYISVTTIKAIRASGGSDIVIQGTLTTEKLFLKVSGGSDFRGKVAVTHLEIEQSGGSDVKIQGTAVNVKVEANGGSDFHGYELLAEYAILQASGGSDAQLSVSKEIAVEATGGSDVHYKGDPVMKYKSSSGGSSVGKRGK
jgi:hypothetical protein